MNTSQRIAVILLAMLCAVLVLWYGLLWPPRTLPLGAVLGLLLAPALPGLVLGALDRPAAGFWSGVACLLYFSHGVMEAWTTPNVRALAYAEVVLAVATVVASSWGGVRKRFARRRMAAD